MEEMAKLIYIIGWQRGHGSHNENNDVKPGLCADFSILNF